MPEVTVTAPADRGRLPFRCVANAGITPYAASQAQQFHLPGYVETSTTGTSLFGLTYGAQTFNSARSEAGARFDWRVAASETSVVSLRGQLAWGHEFSRASTLNAGFNILPGTTFAVSGTRPARDTLIVAAGPEWRFANGWALRGKFADEFAGGMQSYAGSGTLRFTW